MPTLKELKETDPEKYEQIMEQYSKISQGVATGMSKEASRPAMEEDDSEKDSPYKKIKGWFGR